MCARGIGLYIGDLNRPLASGNTVEAPWTAQLMCWWSGAKIVHSVSYASMITALPPSRFAISETTESRALRYLHSSLAVSFPGNAGSHSQVMPSLLTVIVTLRRLESLTVLVVADTVMGSAPLLHVLHPLQCNALCKL